MAGHSKWKQIKRKKAVTDARRGALFTKLIREITIAAKQGGGDPAGNARLRTAIDAAKTENMPLDNIERAVKKGTGELEGVTYEEVTYEAYGPGGAALLIEATTDNPNRTVAEIRHVFQRHGGNLGATNSVAWMFDRKAQVTVDGTRADEDAVMEAALDADHRTCGPAASDQRTAQDQENCGPVGRARPDPQEHGQGGRERREAPARADRGAGRNGRRREGLLEL